MLRVRQLKKMTVCNLLLAFHSSFCRWIELIVFESFFVFLVEFGVLFHQDHLTPVCGSIVIFEMSLGVFGFFVEVNRENYIFKNLIQQTTCISRSSWELQSDCHSTINIRRILWFQNGMTRSMTTKLRNGNGLAIFSKTSLEWLLTALVLWDCQKTITLVVQYKKLL